MEEISINARRRLESGKGAAHRLRAAGNIPGVFYLGHESNLPLELNAHELHLALRKKPKLLLLKLDDGSQHECLVREVQRDPVSGKYTHIDLMGIVSGQKVTVRVEIELTGSAFGVRMQGGILQQSIHQLNIECLPREIPEKVTLDVTELKVGSSLHVRDLAPENYRVMDEADLTIATVLAPKVEKAPEVVEEAKPAEEGAEAAEAPEGEKKEKEKEKEKKEKK
jgi:large subunit ribosomal protein L25